MTYIYVKKTPPTPRPKLKLNLSASRRTRRLLALILLLAGLAFLSSAVFPIIQFQLAYAGRFQEVINPLSSRFYNRQNNILGDVDYTQLNNWFISNSTNSAPGSIISSPSNTYYISIPRLNIDSATVEVGSLDLKRSLI